MTLIPRRAALALSILALGLLTAGCGSSDTKTTSTKTPAADTTTTAATSTTQVSVSSTPGPEGPPLEQGSPLTAGLSDPDGTAKDGVQCNTSEQLVYHIHAHLQIFVNGKSRALPLAIGIKDAQVQQTQAGDFAGGGSCFYWLHTHAEDGIIHIESPTETTYKLSQFFAVWGQPLSPTQVGPAKGKVTAWLNGKVYQGDPNNIPLKAHAVIQLDVGTPVAGPIDVDFPNGL